MSDTKKPPPPTRRGFLAILGGAAAVIAVGLPPEQERLRSPWTAPDGKLRWIGHC
ncbi:MAG: twin-arginine translocation signal domain-containing protein [Kofleriaceae bacterium]